MSVPSNPFQSASLYVGDLNNDISEGLLFELFNRVGPVASIRVCRDTVTRRSLGYAYVNFHNAADAERALDTMNFTDIKGRPCRIMWSQRDPSLRKSGVGNIFVKNLAPTVDNKGLYDIFSVFGNILSCKVTTDEAGLSKGYGYVHYETAEAASEATQKVNGMILEDQEVVVGPFLRRQDRSTENEWTNLYVKQFDLAWDDEKLFSIFSQYGELSSLKLARNIDGQSKGFAFVDYKTHESADMALKDLHGKIYEGAGEDGSVRPYELYVSKAQKKVERSRVLKQRLGNIKNEQMGKSQGMNLYVKNIDDTLTDDDLRELFTSYGTITSAKIMKEDGTNASKGFGFVCFTSPEESTHAVTEMNGKMINGKPIFVTLHQRKEIRRAQLAASHARSAPRFPMGQSPQGMQYPMYGGQQQMPPRPPYQMMPQMMPRGPGRGGVPGYFPPGPRGYPLPSYAMGMPMGPGPMQAMQGPGSPGFKRGGPGGPMQQGGRGGRGMGGPQAGGRGMGGPPGGGRGYPPQQQQQQMRQGGAPPNMKYNSQVRNQPPQQGMPMGGQMPPQMGGPMHQQQPNHLQRPSDGLDHNILAQADFATQKNMIGERLYPLILQQKPDLAGKITGMLLEMDNAELLHLLESPEALASKTQEAIAVLQAHQGI